MTVQVTCLRLRFALLLMLLAGALSGCMSMVGLGYGHADSLAAWKADQYFDLDPEQERAFSDRFEQLYTWHRYKQLPEYVAFLGAGKDRLQRGLTAEDIDWFAEGLKERYRLIVRRGASDAAALLATLTPEQIGNLQRRWEKDNQRYVDERKIDRSLDDRQRARAKRIMAQVKDWVGSLTGTQEKRIAALAYALPDTERMRHEDRMRRQREFVQLLEGRRGDRREFTARLVRWLLDWEAGRDPEYARLADASWRQRVELYVAVARILTPEQRDNALHRLQNHISEFQRLSQSGN
jgi:hypothetical protein